MQTIEEYKAYTRQLENDVGKWHHAYDAPKPSTARCKYCGKAYPVGELGRIGYGVYICRGCA